MAKNTGIIAIWLSNSPPPKGWKLCDGTHGTPDLRDRFPKGISLDAIGNLKNPGTLGGRFLGSAVTASANAGQIGAAFQGLSYAAAPIILGHANGALTSNHNASQSTIDHPSHASTAFTVGLGAHIGNAITGLTHSNGLVADGNHSADIHPNAAVTHLAGIFGTFVQGNSVHTNESHPAHDHLLSAHAQPGLDGHIAHTILSQNLDHDAHSGFGVAPHTFTQPDTHTVNAPGVVQASFTQATQASHTHSIGVANWQSTVTYNDGSQVIYDRFLYTRTAVTGTGGQNAADPPTVSDLSTVVAFLWAYSGVYLPQHIFHAECQFIMKE